MTASVCALNSGMTFLYLLFKAAAFTTKRNWSQFRLKDNFIKYATLYDTIRYIYMRSKVDKMASLV